MGSLYLLIIIFDLIYMGSYQCFPKISGFTCTHGTHADYAPALAILLKQISYTFFMWQSEGQSKNFWIVGEPFIGAGTVDIFRDEHFIEFGLFLTVYLERWSKASTAWRVLKPWWKRHFGIDLLVLAWLRFSIVRMNKSFSLLHKCILNVTMFQKLCLYF